MKHLKGYQQFNEELDPTAKRAITLIPNVLLGLLGKKLFGIYPMLNTKWGEMKRATKGLKYTPLHTGSESVIKHELEEVTIDKLPPNSLKWGMFLRDWKVYLAKGYKSTGGGEYGKLEREVIYISKDKIKEGDQVRANRLSDSDIYPESDFTMGRNKKGKAYPDKLKDPANFPMVIMVAKYDELEKVKNIQDYVDDICLEIEDNYPVEVKPYFSKEQDFLSLSIKEKNDKPITFTQELAELIDSVASRVKEYMKMEGYKFNYSTRWKVKGPLFYNGTAGRFGTEIIQAAKEWSARNDTDSDKPLWNDYYKTLDIEKLSDPWRERDILYTSTDDINTLLSDLGNCTKSWSLNYDMKKYPDRADELKERNKVEEIQIKSIYIPFNKVK